MTIAGGGPLYAQVRDLVIERIHRGEWKPGEPIPSEIRLARDLSVSQGTVRKAIGELVADNVLVRRQGKGTYVANHDSYRALFHFFHVVADRGERALPESRAHSKGQKRATREEAAALSLQSGETVIRVERVRSLGGSDIIAETISVPARLFPGLQRLPVAGVPNTLYELYEREHGITIHRAEERLKAVRPGSRIAQLLGVDRDEPLLRIERVAYTLDGKPVEWRVSYCNTARHHYANSIT